MRYLIKFIRSLIKNRKYLMNYARYLYKGINIKMACHSSEPFTSIHVHDVWCVFHILISTIGILGFDFNTSEASQVLPPYCNYRYQL